MEKNANNTNNRFLNKKIEDLNNNNTMSYRNPQIPVHSLNTMAWKRTNYGTSGDNSSKKKGKHPIHTPIFKSLKKAAYKTMLS